MPRIRSDAADIATTQIIKMITDHQLVTGDSVSDMELSKQFNMSRTPIREAMITLIESGILERTRTKVVVKAVTMEDVIEILDVRDAIENKAIDIIFDNKYFNEEKLNILLEVQKKLDENISNGNYDANFKADRTFHQTLISFAGNQRFVDIYKRISLQFSRLRWLTTLTPNRYEETKLEHNNIIEALKSGDKEKCKNYAHYHIVKTKENYQQILNSPYWNHIADEIKRMKNT